MERERSRRRDASPPPPPPSVGFRSWVLLLLFSLLVLLFFPSFRSSSFRGFRPFAVRNGWDVLNLLLVLFAVLCGVLSRRSGGSDEDDTDRFPRQWVTEKDEWRGFAHHRVRVSCFHRPVEAWPENGILRLRSGGSYPVLRPDGATLDAGGGAALRDWHRHDDEQLYGKRVESGGWERERVADFESKMLAVDTYVLRRSPSPRSRSPPSPPSPPPQPPPTRRDELPVREVDKNGIFVLQNPRPPPSSPPQPPPTRRDELPVREADKNEIFVLRNLHSPASPPPPPARQSQRQPRRRRKAEEVPESREVDRDEIFGPEDTHPRPPSHPPATQRQRRRRSMEKFSEDQLGQNVTFKEKDAPLQASATPRHRRRRSVGDIPKREVDPDPGLGLEKPHISSPASPPSPPMALPSPQPQEEEEEEKKRHKKRSGGGARDIAAAIALFYPRKKGNKTKISSNETTLRGEEPASSAPPPPPPLPPPPPPHSSVFHLFSQKKGGSKNRRIHSDSASAQPPPPPPPTLTRQSREQVLHSSPPAPSPPPPAPSSHNWHDKGKEKVYHNESSPLSPSYSLPPRPEKSNLSSPFPPQPAHPPPSMHHPISEEEIAGHRVRRAPGEGVAMMKSKEREPKERVAVSCPSPDVDNKADLFIARFHANLKLEKQNSMREKERRKQRKESKRA